MRPGYYVDGDHCLWVIYPRMLCSYHLSPATFTGGSELNNWLTSVFGDDEFPWEELTYLGPL